LTPPLGGPLRGAPQPVSDVACNYGLLKNSTPCNGVVKNKLQRTPLGPLIKVDPSFNNEINNYMVQSARNFSGSSETIRQLSEKNNGTRPRLRRGGALTAPLAGFAGLGPPSPASPGSAPLKGRTDSSKFNLWLAGVLDGDGYFDVRVINGAQKLKAIKIKLHNRDIRILNRILDN